MSKELMQVFSFNDVPVRTIEKDGSVYFVAKDVALEALLKDACLTLRAEILDTDCVYCGENIRFCKNTEQPAETEWQAVQATWGATC